jgi:hypothetical protein
MMVHVRLESRVLVVRGLARIMRFLLFDTPGTRSVGSLAARNGGPVP